MSSSSACACHGDAPGWGWAFEEIARRHHDFAIVGVAVGIKLSDDRIAEARIAFAGAGGTALRAPRRRSSCAEKSLPPRRSPTPRPVRRPRSTPRRTSWRPAHIAGTSQPCSPSARCRSRRRGPKERNDRAASDWDHRQWHATGGVRRAPTDTGGSHTAGPAAHGNPSRVRARRVRCLHGRRRRTRRSARA